MLSFAMLLAAQLAGAAPEASRYDGTCLYPQAVEERAAPGELVMCNQVRIADNAISFGRRGWQTRTRFNGSFEGDRLTVTSVTLPNNRTLEARGVCQLYHANDALSTVACTATARSGSMAANFVVSRN